MRTWRDVARYHLVMPWVVVGMPWAIMAFSFVVNLVIFSDRAGQSPPRSDQSRRGRGGQRPA